MILKSTKQLCVLIAMFVAVSIPFGVVSADRDDVFDRFIQRLTGEIDCNGQINGSLPDEGTTPVDDETPCEGSLSTYAASQDRLRTTAYFRWNTDEIDAMRDDNNNNEYMDITPYRCGLEVYEISTNLPNHGTATYKDGCRKKKEAEVHLRPESIYADQLYLFQTRYNCRSAGVWEVAVTFEHDAPTGRDWLSDTQDNCQNSRSANKQTSSGTSQMIMSKDNQEYSYKIFEGNGEYDVAVNINFDYNNLSKHMGENTTPLSRKSSKTFETGMVVITFQTPLTVEQANSFVERTGIEILDYGLFGKNENDTISVYRFPDSDNALSFDNTWESGEGHVYDVDGIMTIRGVINLQSMNVLESDSNILLLDTTGIEVQTEIYDELGITVNPEDISLSNPAWQVYDNMTEEPTSVSVQSTITNSRANVGYILSIGIFILLMFTADVRTSSTD